MNATLVKSVPSHESSIIVCLLFKNCSPFEYEFLTRQGGGWVSSSSIPLIKDFFSSPSSSSSSYPFLFGLFCFQFFMTDFEFNPDAWLDRSIIRLIGSGGVSRVQHRNLKRKTGCNALWQLNISGNTPQFFVSCIVHHAPSPSP